MVWVQWNDGLRVGHPTIDADHEKLFAVLESLQSAMKQGKGPSVLAGLLNELARRSELHFRQEEVFMREIGFPYYDAHKAEHDMLMKEVKALQMRVNTGKLTISVGVCHFLNHWLSRHIQDSDAEFVDALVAVAA